MPRSKNQKLKILYILDAMKKTDKNNPTTVNKLIAMLAENDINAERKSIYEDLDSLGIYGYKIERTGRGNRGIYLDSKEFELAEIKLLIDAVQSCKFITEKSSSRLIEKLAGLYTGGEQATLLKRQTMTKSGTKTHNENVFASIDILHRAIAENKTVTFLYYTYVIDNGRIKKELRRDGKKYCVSPWRLMWDDEFYYLLAHDNENGILKHYRVDKLGSIELTDSPRECMELYKNIDVSDYIMKTFSMFGGDEEVVRISCVNRLAGVIADRFGDGLTILKESDERFIFSVKIKISPQFYGWLFSFGGDMRVLSPAGVVTELKNGLNNVLEYYK